MDERQLAGRLIAYDTSCDEGLRSAAAFVKGWLETNDIAVDERSHNGLPVLLAEVGPADGPSVILHGHLDVVRARPGQFEPRIEGDRLIGRGAYDMKGALAGMLFALRDAASQDKVRVRLICVPDEESEDVGDRSTDAIVAAGFRGDFAITGEPTDLQIGVEAKGVLAIRVELAGTAAHGSTPWLGDNAILKAIDAFRAVESLPFSRVSSELFDCPSINLARIGGGDAFNKVPDACWMDIDIRYLPGQDAESITAQIAAIPDLSIKRRLHRVPAIVSRSNPYVLALADAAGRTGGADVLTIGRDGASDVISFLAAGVPGVEFGPVGEGHHGPGEWVSLASLAHYRRALGAFVVGLGQRLDREADSPVLRAVDGGRA
ncbi:MAG: M20 family metallopeptidase [Solirubrobacteraceae bacterium]